MWTSRRPIISVILPFYNAQDTLREAIESIRAQTYENWELILLDDGSTDNSCQIALDCAKQDKRLKVFSYPHAGIVAALNAACSVAQGNFLARMDADDISLPHRLELQERLLRTSPRVALCGALIEFFGSTVRIGTRRYQVWLNSLITPEQIQKEIFVECPIPHPTFMMKRDVFEEIGRYQDNAWPEDYDLCFRFLQADWQLTKVPEVLLRWRDSNKRLSRTSERYSAAQFRAIKRHYLLELGYLKSKAFFQWGAGKVGKQWLREWKLVVPRAVVDINPRKIGRVIHGVPVIAPDDLPPPKSLFIVITVGAPGAREEIRDWLTKRRYTETEDFVFVA
ncbi:MAG TPA: glycosyltransferase [Candidatus Hydrogenedentes bacterium]|nr:glycosyltransferase [Candidatus Hydrogenedentota bacterium]HOL76665.1 glycosyltransferase [Candidatus Hydrogenedentota bacterium]HPO84498.1 glycosyltransferase [Candidatus Hydrogenedentota bacterium]